MRGVEPLLPQKLSHLPRTAAGIRLAQDLQLVLRAEPSSLRSSFYFRVGPGLALDRRRPSAAGRLASLAAPSLRVSYGRLFSIGPPGSIHGSFPFTPCSLNSGGVKCLIYIGREGGDQVEGSLVVPDGPDDPSH